MSKYSPTWLTLRLFLPTTVRSLPQCDTSPFVLQFTLYKIWYVVGIPPLSLLNVIIHMPLFVASIFRNLRFWLPFLHFRSLSSLSLALIPFIFCFHFLFFRHISSFQNPPNGHWPCSLLAGFHICFHVDFHPWPLLSAFCGWNDLIIPFWVTSKFPRPYILHTNLHRKVTEYSRLVFVVMRCW